ncbi:hypothetical protein SAMN05216371_3857 [Streptomyces sp. TLI_053]|uniref:hypothetical protein n=1 Tax=Streptomyces sp. TLI_053 TaxID=1855352 RepID=UPI00087BB1DC|nr:hypothetical protein [Streptomyces sp. TLI_053]SDT69798.1 hypothetical protein SAMN05216371_3857 [Streptomyces sp. TLI_053]
MIDDELDLDHQDQPAGRCADFDAFFAEQATTEHAETFQLYGRTYRLPDALPLMFTLQMERLQASDDPDDVRSMLRTLVGEDALDHWAEQGMTDRQLGIVLIYAAATVRRPGSITLQRAAELYDQQNAAAGKAPTPPAPNRATRRKTGRRRAGSGRRS